MFETGLPPGLARERADPADSLGIRNRDSGSVARRLEHRKLEVAPTVLFIVLHVHRCGLCAIGVLHALICIYYNNNILFMCIHNKLENSLVAELLENY